MSPRPRKTGNKDLPPHVETNTVNGVTYYRYVMPDGVRHSLGKDKKEAVDAALTLNAELQRNSNLVNKIIKNSTKLHNKQTLYRQLAMLLNNIKNGYYSKNTLKAPVIISVICSMSIY